MASPEPQSARILPWPRPLARPLDEREFLPAALEIIETPASPLGRGLAFAILAFFAVAIAWSWFGHVDIIATAEGRVAPTGRTKLVQPLDSGIVRQILVRNGEHVRAGALLIRLDDTIARADRDRAAHELIDAELDIARLTALSRQSDPKLVAKAFAPPAGASRPDADRALALALSQAREQADKLAGIGREIAKTRAQEQETEIGIQKLVSTLPYIKAKRDLYKKLLKLEYANRVDYYSSEQALLDARHDLTAEQQKAIETKASLAALEKQRDQTLAEYARKVLDDLEQAEQKASEDKQNLIQARQKVKQTELRAPIAGIVQQLAVHTVGGVVTPAEPLLVIVPEHQQLVVDATLRNSDVGFVHVGQKAQIKVKAFNFTRYGLMHGRVVYLSQDAVSQNSQTSGRTNAPSGGKRSGSKDSASPAYVARIKLTGQSMLIDGRRQPLRPGMAVTAEIKTGSRRILSYLLSPLRKYAQDAIRER